MKKNITLPATEEEVKLIDKIGKELALTSNRAQVLRYALKYVERDLLKEK